MSTAAKIPAILGRVRETNKFYETAAERALQLISAERKALVVRFARNGMIVVDDKFEIDLKFHVLTINHRTDPAELAANLSQCAFDLGFDEGIRNGRKRKCR
jgi:hypothetical protein